jgi:hypothetical protein
MGNSRFEITYCSNIHPIKSFDDLCETLNGPCANVASHFKENPFNLGLWLPEDALSKSLCDDSIIKINKLIGDNQFKPITFNGFPYSIFHGEPVKTKVYSPDWSDPKRLEYTKNIARFAEKLGLEKTVISSLSGGFRQKDDEEKVDQYIDHWIEWVQWCEIFESETGFLSQCALEPEPFNTMEKEKDIYFLWEKLEKKAITQNISRQSLNRHLGICLDTCHFSVRFESPARVFKNLKSFDIPVFKSQISLAPHWDETMEEQSLQKFFNCAEPFYLHQTYGLNDEGELMEFLDLNLAEKTSQQAKQWRTHFHIPIFLSEKKNTTGKDLIEFLNLIKLEKNPPILEVETYSFNALSDMYKVEITVEESIVKELEWLKKQLEN